MFKSLQKYLTPLFFILSQNHPPPPPPTHTQSKVILYFPHPHKLIDMSAKSCPDRDDFHQNFWTEMTWN